MKKIVIAAVLSLAVVLSVSVAVYSAIDTFIHDDFNMKTAERVGITTETALQMSLDFYLPEDSLEYLEKRNESVRVFAVALDYESGMPAPKSTSGTTVDLSPSGSFVIGEKTYRKYTYNLGVILPENYNKSYAVKGFTTYTLNGETYEIASDYTIKNNVITPYDRVYSAFSDRSAVKTDAHPYEAGDGTFVSVKDLNALRKILSAVLYIEIKGDKAIDTRENEYYKSLYNIEYFDGVLTLSIGNPDFPEWLLGELYINGTRRYFEIYEGKIKLVV